MKLYTFDYDTDGGETIKIEGSMENGSLDYVLYLDEDEFDENFLTDSDKDRINEILQEMTESENDLNESYMY